MMKKRVLRCSWIVAVMIGCLAAATPAWAGITIQKLDVYLKGVNRYGCLTYSGGQCAPFCAVINTCTGDFVGSATGWVCNESRCVQVYTNVNLFNNYNSGPIGISASSQSYYNACVKASVYVVSNCGFACYVALGTLNQYN